MPDSPTSEPDSAFVCDCGGWQRIACNREPFYKEHEGKRYCVLHFPSKGKSVHFTRVLQRKLDEKDFNFLGVWFPDDVSFHSFDFSAAADFRWATFSAAAYFSTFSAAADFRYATFSAEADFHSATFSAAADFNSATFSAAAYFSSATFSAAAYFSSATFSAAADFILATFSRAADFHSATFSAAYFILATFSRAADFSWATFSANLKFTEVTFEDYVKFAGSQSRKVFSNGSSLDLQFARIERPDHLSFHTAALRPSWFVNVDARKFEFTNVEWTFAVKQEIRDLSSGRDGLAAQQRLLAIACRNLAVNAEENHRYEEASKFRYLAMEARRRETWRGFVPWRLSWWYWVASGYGERVFKAFMILLGIWLAAGLLYTFVGFARWEPKLASEADVVSAKRDEVGAPLKFSRALTYSAGVMTFQKPEPRPATPAAQTVVLFETILGPVQAALLALAIRRKFMR